MDPSRGVAANSRRRGGSRRPRTVLRFAFHAHADSGPVLDLRGAYLLGTDGVPVKGELRVERDQIVCETRNPDPLGLSLLWRVRGGGIYQLETTRLLPRSEPYDL